MAFPSFPQFRKFILSDFGDYQEFYKTCPPYSDFSFNNLMIWLNFNDDLQVSEHQGNLIFRFSNIFEDGTLTYTLLGTKNCQKTVEALLDFLRFTKQPPILKMVPDCVAHDIESNLLMPVASRPQFHIKEDRDNRDYIFEVAEAVMAKGGQHAKYRQKVHAFLRQYGTQTSVRRLEIAAKETKELLAQHLEEWQQYDNFMYNDSDQHEKDAILRHINLRLPTPAQCLGVFIDDVLVSFAIFHKPPQDGWIIFNHIKCHPNYKNLFDITYYFCVQEFLQCRVQWINFEQDLGIEGLRIHKERLRPSHYLHRNVIEG